MTGGQENTVRIRGASAVVIYEHGLLGEGLGARLRDRGIATVVVPPREPGALVTALRACPTVVIAERTTPECQALIRSLSPGSRVIDVGKVVGRGCQDSSEMVHFEVILDALGAH